VEDLAMLFGPALMLAPLMLAAGAAELSRPDPEVIEKQVISAIQTRRGWHDGDQLKFGVLKPVTCRDGLLGRSKSHGWALEFTWAHAGAASERLHARVTPQGAAVVGDGAVTDVGSACRWAD
jgi:hypothetical protein